MESTIILPDRVDWSERILAAGWVVLLVCLPMTSLVLFGGQAGNLRPLSTLLAVVLSPLVLLASWRAQAQDSATRRLGLVFGWFSLIALVTLWCGEPEVPSAKPTGVSLFVKGVLSLFGGASVYLFARNRLRTADDLRRAATWICLGAILTVGLSLLQVVSQLPALSFLRPPVVDISSWFSMAYDVRSVPHAGRAHGMSYEPSYMASHLNLLVFPIGFWLLVDGQRKRLGCVLLAIAVFGIALAGSRLGLMCGMTLMILGVISLLIAKQRQVAGLAVVVLVAVCVVSVPVIANSYVTNVTNVTNWDMEKKEPANGRERSPAVLSATNTGARAAVVIAGMQVWLDHPMSGVGLGLSPKHLDSHIPEWGVRWSEISAHLDRESPAIMNPMAMSVRLLAEGGLIGLLLVGWFVWAHRPRRLASAKLLAGLAITALGFDALVLASFALPSGWILLAAVLAVDDYESRHRQPPSAHV